MILITGATGKLGRQVLAQLLEKVPARDVAVAVRDPKKAEDLAAKGVDVRYADYAKPETLSAAHAGVEKLLLISSSEVGQRAPQHAAVIDAATKAGVKLLADTDVGITRGELDDRSGEMHRLIGRATTPLAKVVASAVAR